MKLPKLKIGDKVTSTLNQNFLGYVIAITQREAQYTYTVSYFKEDEPLTIVMYGFEIQLVVENGNIGFGKKEPKNG